MGISNIKRILAVVLLSSFAFVVYADDAPVYEVDNYPPPFDSQSVDASSSQEAPPPPPVAYSGGLSPEVSHNSPSGNAVLNEAYPPPAVTPPPPPPRPLSSEQRLQRAEQQIKNLQQSSSLAKAEELQKEVQSLRGQIEEMSHQLQQVQTQQKAMYADLDKRFAGIQVSKSSAANVVHDVPMANSTVKPSVKVTSSAANAVATPKVVSQPNLAEEQQIYQNAYDLIKAKRYNDAIATLQKMLQKYPSGPTAANAHYWLGELYGLLNKTEQSISEFALVVKKYPTSSKASDAQLKLGLIYLGQFKWVDAKSAFKGVVARSPGTSSARLASEQLKQIKKAGH